MLLIFIKIILIYFLIFLQPVQVSSPAYILFSSLTFVLIQKLQKIKSKKILFLFSNILCLSHNAFLDKLFNGDLALKPDGE